MVVAVSEIIIADDDDKPLLEKEDIIAGTTTEDMLPYSCVFLFNDDEVDVDFDVDVGIENVPDRNDDDGDDVNASTATSVG